MERRKTVTIGQNIATIVRAVKEERSLSRRELAKELGASSWKVHQYMSGNWKINMRDIELLSSRLRTDAASLICSHTDESGREIIGSLLGLQKFIHPFPRDQKIIMTFQIIKIIEDDICSAIQLCSLFNERLCEKDREILVILLRIQTLICMNSVHQRQFFAAQILELISEDLKCTSNKILDMVAYRIPMHVSKYSSYYDSVHGRVYFAECPKCGSVIDRDFQNYCGRCGQALCW